MGKSYNSYSVTYRPYPQEFERTRELFIQSLLKKFGDMKKYIISPESGGKKTINYYQIYLSFEKEKRQDTFKKAVLRMIDKFELTNTSVALKVNGISRDEAFSIGYVLKEHDTYDNLVIKGITTDELDKAKDYYLSSIREKRCSLDKSRVSIKNLPEIFKTFIECNNIKLDWSNPENIGKVLGLMGQTDYYMMPIIHHKDIKKIIKYLSYYLRNQLDKYVSMDMRSRFMENVVKEVKDVNDEIIQSSIVQQVCRFDDLI